MENNKYSFLFILQFDSFIRNLMPVIQNLESSGNHCDIILYKQMHKRQWLTPRILKILDNHPFTQGNFKLIKNTLCRNYHVVTIGSIGARFIPRIARFIEKMKLPTLSASGYIGALLDNSPDIFRKGVTRRSETNLIWTPGKESAESVLDTGIVDTNKTQITPTGLPVFDQLYRTKNNFHHRGKEFILFIEQPTFPKTMKERTLLVKYLIDLAVANPQKKLVIKPRFTIKTGHTHRPKFLLPDLLNKFDRIPSNLEISHLELHELFKNTDFAVTISSTGGLESLLFEIPTYFINDFCKGKNLYGTHYFKATNGVLSIQDLISGKRPVLNFDVVADKMRFDGCNCNRLCNALIELAEKSDINFKNLSISGYFPDN